MNATSSTYPIGTPGRPWGETEKAAWRARQRKLRSYADDVQAAVDALRERHDVQEYGRLDYPPDGTYPLVALRSRAWREGLPLALVTGGVHGYETSGVHGALHFARDHLADYDGRLNVLVAPCISPWAYERIHRWNPHAVDPNRSFREPSPAAESAALLQLVAPLRGQFLVHVDLHETTDSDEGEFRPALAARDGKAFEPGSIPDGFYTVGDTDNPQLEFQAAIIRGVERVTHIAPADDNGQIIGARVVQKGVILYAFKPLGLCAGVTDARFTSTTEVYPDSPSATPASCIDAQVAAVTAALDHALARA